MLTVEESERIAVTAFEHALLLFGGTRKPAQAAREALIKAGIELALTTLQNYPQATPGLKPKELAAWARKKVLDVDR